MEEREESKRTKSQKLYDKVNDLATKIENEPNVIKRTLYSIRAKLVLAKIQRQIDIKEIRDRYEAERKQNDEEAEFDEIDSRDDIIYLTSRVNELQDEIKRNSNYDYQSSKFMFGKGEVERKGGVDNYIERLKQSGRLRQVTVAERMKYVEELKKELSDRQAELADKQERLAEIDDNRKLKNKTSKTEETALVVKKKINIFAKISNFFRNVVAGIKEGKAQHQDIENKKAQGIEREDGKFETREEALTRIETEYQKMKEKVLAEYEGAENSFKGEQAKSQANNFREQVRQMAAKTGYEMKPEEAEAAEGKKQEEEIEDSIEHEETR